MKKEPELFIEHMLASIELIEKYAFNKTEDDFLDSEFFQDAIIRRIEIIGEAAKNVPLDIKQSYPEIPWSEIVRMRDKLAHHYFGIDLPRAWKVVKNDLPQLKSQILKIKQSLH